MQLKGRLTFGPPKGNKRRTNPLRSSVRELLAAYLAQYPARDVTLPWGDLAGTPTTVRLIITGVQGGALNRNTVNHDVWKPALTKVGVRAARENGMHALRTHYASVLLDAGESIKAVSEYLGHTDAGFTLRTYTHLMPSSDERTRRAVDDAFACYMGATSADGEAGGSRCDVR